MARDGVRKTYRTLSCIPKQRYHFQDKVEWAEGQLKQHRPDIFVLPQEYHGGIQHFFFKDLGTDEKVSYTTAELTDPYVDLARRYSCGITVGGLIDDPALGERRERIFIIDPDRGITGFADKVTLPAYDHVDAKGKTRVFPEVNLENRAQAYPILDARVSILFCWEVYSSFIWHAISRAQPDFTVSMVKFGVRGWPRKAKVDGESVVEGFGYGGDGGWLERLQMAAKWDTASPIICSTNSWNLPKKCGALAGILLPWEEKETSGQYARHARKHSLVVTEGKGIIDQDIVVVDDLDWLYWRLVRDHKFALNSATRGPDDEGEWPSAEARELTMNWKVRRMERGVAGLPKLMAPVGSKSTVKTPSKRTSDEGLGLL